MVTKPISQRFNVNAKTANEENLPDHRTVNASGELEWKKRNVSAAQIATVKKAVLKSVAQRNESRFALSENATNILTAAHDRKLQEANNTAAARTIDAHSTSEPSVKSALPKEFSDSRLATDVKVQKNVADANDTAIRMPNWDTKLGLPAEFAAAKQKAGALKTWTDASETINRPTDIGFIDTSNLDQGNISPNQPSAKPPKNGNPIDGVSMGGRTYRDHPNQEKEWDVNLDNPKKPVQNQNPDGNPYTGAI
jgi:hypothetical protein